MNVRLYRYELPTRHVFTIARGSTTVYTPLIVDLEHNGLHGYGEAGESDYYGATVANMAAAIDLVRAELEASAPIDPERLWDRCDGLLCRNRFAQCALDMAAWDLWGKLQGAPLWKLWGLSLDTCPVTDYTIGIDTIDTMVAKLNEFPQWPVYKIKLGTPHDLEIVAALRKHTEAVFRVDANCAWGVEQTIRNAAELKHLGVELIEQPLPPEDWSGMRRVYRESALPVVADESCQVSADVDRAAGCFHGVNIKLVKCGGLTPARRMIARARRLGLKVMIGCMTESTVGISAIAQLLPLLDWVDMDGALLLASDPASGVRIERGVVRHPTENGCGVRLTAAGSPVGFPG
jgi:L-alanine-DL-glutamate epimerase-like enolase superfamily enzyme